jgi:recombination protein RecR
MIGPEIQRLITFLSKLPGLGPRSGRRAALHLLKNRDQLLFPLVKALQDAAEHLGYCSQCGNLDTHDPCSLCTDPKRDPTAICVIEDVTDLWALEKTGSYRGLYHVLGGTLSALDGRGPNDLRIASLLQRASNPEVKEIIFALSATIDGRTTVHYLMNSLAHASIKMSELAHGVPLGGELDYLDEGTLTTALRARRSVTLDTPERDELTGS